ncbi:MAG: EAL domain-containing protein [Ruminococcus sp.]|nr:EAL domain-containing protein [Ruminococcus sp.]
MEKTARREKSIRRKVLVVDDEPVNRRLLGYIVSRDYDVIYSENGVQALELIRENERLLSLILLDLLMPEMDGYELLEILHSDPTLHRIPVIVLTSEKTAEVKSLQLGAADFIPKPYDLPEVILARVRRSIELAEDNIIIHEAETDTLTDLYTKELFYQYSKQHDRYCADMEMDALVLNVNRFHLVNELYGRELGNKVLRLISDSIREYLRENDGLACRCEADIFYIYTPHRDDHKPLLDSCTEKLVTAVPDAKISFRLGIYSSVDMSIDIEQRFDRANLACTGRKNSYSNSCNVYDTQLHEKELYNERLMRDLDKALEEKQFRVFYQPKYDIRQDKPVITSAEALIRWFHPELGFVSPGAFIPLFEENGLVQKVDRYVWREAAQQIKRWKDKYGRVVPVSVNVSRMDIYDPALEELLLDIVRRNELQPGEYLLEITESAYTDNSDQIINTVQQLRSDGFRVEMDDFGSGYSSLNMLAALPIDALKLDMRFVRNICESDKDLRLMELVIEIADFLSVPVIAEGVETEEQYKLLKKIGCDIIQGYYFSKPLPEEEFSKLLEAEAEAEQEAE